VSYTAAARQWDHELVIGDTYHPADVTLKDSAGDAYDITGASGTALITTEPTGGTTLATPTVALVTDGSDGQFRWTVAAATTAALTAGTRAHYSVRLTFADGTKRTILYGVVEFVKHPVSS
jgi:hypothetical protein